MRRRDFIKNTATIFGGFALKPYSSPFVRALSSTNTDNVLVLVQLIGGNDGLNTVVPLEYYSNYYNARPNIALAESSILKLNDATGLHPSLAAMKNLYSEGKLAVLQSVGYGNPNFSHFRSTDIWMSGSDSTQNISSGWAGRYLDMEYPGFPFDYPTESMPDPLAIQIGPQTNLTLQGPAAGMGMCIENPDSFYDFLDGVEDPVPDSAWGDELRYVREVARQTDQYSQVIKNAADRVPTQGQYPADNMLAAQLKIVARLIKGGLKTRVYMVSEGSFDTHANQLGFHSAILQRMSDAIKAFCDDVQGLGIEDRVVGVTFSEFGRRIKSNSSGGTDHGAAAPMFVFGKNVMPGIMGTNPVIPSDVNSNDNIPFQFDFRSVYASLLQDLFCVNPVDIETILFRNFQHLNLVANSTCAALPLIEVERIRQRRLSSEQGVINQPNPFTDVTKVSFYTKGGHTLVQIIDNSGRVIKILTDEVYRPGVVNIDFDSRGFPPGVYYVRLQNDYTTQMRSMLKVK